MNRLFSILFFFFVVLSVNAQTKVSGQVFDASDNPVPFANVVFKGSSVGVITNEEGTFYIEDENTWDVLKISFIEASNSSILLLIYFIQSDFLKLFDNKYFFSGTKVLELEQRSITKRNFLAFI